MAPVPATITVNFTSNYAGNHRVCWRTGGAGAYDCSTIVACAGGGAACQAVIAITVDDETCDTVDFDGYVQATCEDIGSLNGRVPFSAQFVPNQPCNMFTITCNTVGVASGTVTAGGSGYTPGASIALVFAGGGGSAAAGNAIVGNGGIKTWTIGGNSGYDTDGFYPGVAATTLTGVGAGATFDVTISGGVITAIALSSQASAGTGYAATDTFKFAPGLIGGHTPGTEATITVDSVNTGEVQHITITAPGSGYSSTPTITIGGSGAGATGTVTLADCAALDLGNDCAGSPITPITGLPLNESAYTCSDGTPAPATGYGVVQEGCCYDCVFVTFTNDDGSQGDLDVRYITCPGNVFTEATVPFGTPLSVCVVDDSWYYDPGHGSHTESPTCP